MNTPEGWKLVPVEPTDKMLEAAWDSDAADYVGEHKRIWQLGLAYSAMLAAAPTLPEQPGESVCATCGGLVSDPVIVQPAAQGEGYLSGVNVESLLRACSALGLSAEHSLEALAVPDVLAEHINRVTRAVIAADRAARKRPEAEVAEIMEAVDRFLVASTGGPGTYAASRSEVERLVRGVGS